MKLKNLFCLLAAAGASFSAQAGESVIHFPSGSYTIAGTLTLPDNVKNPPAFLILHGFTGEKMVRKRLISRTVTSVMLLRDGQRPVLPVSESTLWVVETAVGITPRQLWKARYKKQKKH